MESEVFRDPGLFQQGFVQPPHAVRAVHLPRHRRGEHIRIFGVFGVFLYQKIHRLFRKADRPHRVGGFRLGDPHLTLQPSRRLRDVQGSGVHIKVSPEKGRQLSPSQPRGQLQIEHGQDSMLLGGTEVRSDLLRRKDLHLLFLLRRQTAAECRIERNEPLLHRLLQRSAEHGVESTHRSGTQALVLHALVLLHPAAALGFIVKYLKIQRGEFFQFDLTDAWYDVVLNVTAIIFSGGVLDRWLAVDLVPEPAPLAHCVLSSLTHIDFCAFLNGLCELFFAFLLRLGKNVFIDGLAGDRIMTGGVAALPPAILALADIALAVCSFLSRS